MVVIANENTAHYRPYIISTPQLLLSSTSSYLLLSHVGLVAPKVCEARRYKCLRMFTDCLAKALYLSSDLSTSPAFYIPLLACSMDESLAEFLFQGNPHASGPNVASNNDSFSTSTRMDDISPEAFDMLMTDPSFASMFTFNHEGLSHHTPGPSGLPVFNTHPQPIDPQSQSSAPATSSSLHDIDRFQTTLPPHPPTTDQSPQFNVEAHVQLEILRETRKIREIELSIVEEKRRVEHVLLQQMETELALIHARQAIAQNADNVQLPSSASTPLDPTATATVSQLAPLSSCDSFPGSDSPGDTAVDDATTGIDLTSSINAESGPSNSPHILVESPPVAVNPSPSPVTGTTQTKKKALVADEREARCARCSKIMAKLLLRGTRSELDAPYQLHFLCEICEPVPHPRTRSKKRTNQLEDTTHPTKCSVCTRVQGQGGFISNNRNPLLFTVEVTIKHNNCFYLYPDQVNIGNMHPVLAEVQTVSDPCIHECHAKLIGT